VDGALFGLIPFFILVAYLPLHILEGKAEANNPLRKFAVSGPFFPFTIADTDIF
jgi:hypothetical protein